jgi:hypothetical protein
MMGGTTLRIGNSSGLTILSKALRTGWYGDKMYDSTTLIMIVNINTLKTTRIIVEIIMSLL